MRVTLGMQLDRTAGYLSDAAERLMSAQQVLTTGKRITKPSDDPTLAGRSMDLRSSIRGLEQMQENNNLAKSALSAADDALGSISDELMKLRNDVALDGTPLTVDKRASLLEVIGDIKSRLLDLADTRYMSKYMFSGSKTNTPPLLPSGATPPYTYQGNTDAIQMQIQPSLRVQTNVTADQVFNLDGSAGAGVRDVFTMIDDLTNAVNAGDVGQMSAIVVDIDANRANVDGLRAEVGAREQRLEDNFTALTDTKNRMSDLLSNLEDVDLAQAVVQFQTQQNVYQAALAAASKIGQVSLVDYLS